MSAQVNFSRVFSTSGHFKYKSWGQNSQGEREAYRYVGKDARTHADLASNVYHNKNGFETVFGLVFDLDAHRAMDCFKDSEGSLAWDLILPALEKEIPEVAGLICYVVRSTGGKGLGIVVAISPLVIANSTVGNQKSALKLQGRLLSVFDKLGIGADFGARGVIRDLPNFKNPDKLIFQNQKILRELETARRSVVTELHKLLNARDKAARITERLYNDERVEKGLAKLVLWLLGAMRFNRSIQFDGVDIGTKFKSVPYLSGWEIDATLSEICSLTGLSETFLRKFLANPPEWLESQRYERGGWRLRIAISQSVSWLLERSLYLMQKTQILTGNVSFDADELALPSMVQDGERNAWIVQLALIYKWAGYSRDATLKKITLRMQGIPEYESSRNCRQVLNIVRSLFRRQPETVGIRARKALPDWIRDDEIYCNIFKRVSTRRGKTPGADQTSICDLLASVSFPPSNSIPPFETLREFFENSEVNKEPKTLWVVRRGQRIGIFDGKQLVSCMTKKHYKATRVIEHLVQKDGIYSGLNLCLVSPRKLKQAAFFDAVDSAEYVQRAELICGRKETRCESLQIWRDRPGTA